jgi:hypothetical protein
VERREYPPGAGPVWQQARKGAHTGPHPITAGTFVPKPNYSYEKRQRELEKKRKKEDKAAQKKNPQQAQPDQPAEPQPSQSSQP